MVSLKITSQVVKPLRLWCKQYVSCILYTDSCLCSDEGWVNWNLYMKMQQAKMCNDLNYLTWCSVTKLGKEKGKKRKKKQLMFYIVVMLMFMQTVSYWGLMGIYCWSPTKCMDDTRITYLNQQALDSFSQAWPDKVCLVRQERGSGQPGICHRQTVRSKRWNPAIQGWAVWYSQSAFKDKFTIVILWEGQPKSTIYTTFVCVCLNLGDIGSQDFCFSEIYWK